MKFLKNFLTKIIGQRSAERVAQTETHPSNNKTRESDSNAPVPDASQGHTPQTRKIESSISLENLLKWHVAGSLDYCVEAVYSLIATLDGQLSEQLNLILHHQKFQTLESAWRGLYYLVNYTESDEMLKIRVLDVSKKALYRNQKKHTGSNWDQSYLFKALHDSVYGEIGGEPYGCLVGDYYFDHSPQDIDLLTGIAQIAAATHTTFIAGAAPSILQFDSWSELSNPRNLTKIFQTPEYAAWKSLRESEDSRYVGLTMPRFLARQPYGDATDPVEEFDFEEDTDGTDAERYTWANSAYAMATNINKAFKLYGWCSRIRGIESGGAVEDLPTHTFPTDDGGVAMKCPTEIAISDRREAELAKNGFMPLIHKKNSDFAAFIGAQSLQQPAEYDDPDATANANLAARLPYHLCGCRFVQYLRCIVRDHFSSFRDNEDMQLYLQAWIMQYVNEDFWNSSESTMARKPLGAAEVVIEEIEGSLDHCTGKFYLRPDYHLEGLTVAIRFISKLPSVRGLPDETLQE